MDNGSLQNSMLLPIVDIGEEAAKEKKGRSPIFNLHFWWARKPLVASRASILSLLLPPEIDDRDVRDYLGLGGKKRAYNKDLNANYEELKQYYRKRIGKSRPRLIDPFAGGGSIAYEALRLGLDVVASDYNPIAHNIQLGTLLYPKKFSTEIVQRVEEAFNTLRGNVEKKLSKFYPKIGKMESSTYMYAWGIRCPYCNLVTPAVNNWVLKTKRYKGGKVEWVYLNPYLNGRKIKYEIISEEVVKPTKLKRGNCRRGEVECLHCNSIIPNKIVVECIRNDEIEIPLCKVVILENKSGKHYLQFTEDDLRVITNRKYIRSQIREDYLPTAEMPQRIIASAKYLGTWKNLLNDRQKLFFSVLIEEAICVAQNFRKKYGEPWDKIIATYLAMFVGKSIDFNNRGSSWAAKEGIRNSLAFRRPSMAWDHIEVNPFASKGSGTWQIIQRNIIDGIKRAVSDLEKTPGSIDVILDSVFNLKFSEKFDLVVTDPPYGDDVQYSELSEFFYAWEGIILNKFYDNFPVVVQNDEDLSVNNMDRDTEYVKFALEMAFEKIKELLNYNGQMALFFAHGKLDTWAFVINALRSGRFQINATFPIHTESKDNVIALGKASFMTSVLILATIRKEDTNAVYIEDLQERIIERIREMIPIYLRYGLKDSDLSMVVLGPALQELTSHSDLKSITGEVTFDQILRIANQPLIEELIGGKESINLDSPTKFYLYCRLTGISNLSHDSFQMLSKSMGLETRNLINYGFIEVVGTSKNKHYQIIGHQRYVSDLKSMIDFIHHEFGNYDRTVDGSQNFWQTVSTSKYDVNTIKHILNLISLGHVDSKQVKNILDDEALIAKELLGK